MIENDKSDTEPTKRERVAQRVRLTRKTSEAMQDMLNRVFPDEGVSALDVCAFNSSI